MSSEDSSQNIELPLLTFNSLYNILREEKKEKTLQKLPEMFYEALQKFFTDKKKEILKIKDSGDKSTLKREMNVLNNSKKIAKDLLNLRCMKISNIGIKDILFSDELLSKENILEKEIIYLDSVSKAVLKIGKELSLKWKEDIVLP